MQDMLAQKRQMPLKLQRKKHTGTAVKKIEEKGLAPYSSTLRRSSYAETGLTE